MSVSYTRSKNKLKQKRQHFTPKIQNRTNECKPTKKKKKNYAKFMQSIRSSECHSNFVCCAFCHMNIPLKR